MKKSYLSVLACAAIITTNINATDLGTISVESSTIDDKFMTKKTEISSVSEINGEAVDNSHIENIQQILQAIPGITTESSTGDSFKIHIRGVENQRYMGEKPGVAVVIDGVPVFERTGKVNIDLDNIESIKVIKGGASYLFGEDALSGAVIITTKKGAKYDNTYIAGEAGSFGYSKGVVRQGFSDENYSGHIQVSQRKADGFWEDSEYKTQYINGKYQYYLDESSDLTFGLEYSDRQKDSHGTVKGVTQALENPESIDDGTGANRDYTRKYDVELVKLFTTYSKDLDSTQNILFNAYQYTDDTSYLSSPIKYDTSGNSVTSPESYGTFNDYSQTQRGVKSEWRKSSNSFATLLGIDVRDNEYQNKAKINEDYCSRVSYTGGLHCVTTQTAGTITQDDITDENVYAIYGEVKKTFNEKLVLTANGRYDKMKMDYSDTLNSINVDKSFDVGSYRLGATYQIDKSTLLYTNASTGFRTPTIDQLFAGDISPTGSTLSNHDLKPETSYTYDIGLRGTSKLFNTSISYDTTVFQIDRDDYIMSTAGQYSKPETGVTSRYENIGGMRNRGLEMSLNSDSSKIVSFNLAYTYLQAKFTKYDNFYLGLGNPYISSEYSTEQYNLAGYTVPRTSKHTLNLQANIKPNDNFTLTTELNARSSYYADELNRVEIAGYEVVNLLASYTTKVDGMESSFFFRIDNALNKYYYTSARGSSDSDYDGDFDAEDISITVNQGRTVTAGVSVKF